MSGWSLVWFDETKLELSGHMDAAFLWQRKGEAFDPKITVLTVKHGVERLFYCFKHREPCLGTQGYEERHFKGQGGKFCHQSVGCKKMTQSICTFKMVQKLLKDTKIKVLD